MITPIAVWGGLMLLFAVTLGSSYVPLGGFNSALNFIIAFAKAGLIAVFYMRLRSSDVIVRLAAAAGVVWVAILMGLSLVDVLTRSP